MNKLINAISTNSPQNVEQFNLVNENVYLDNLVGDLTNWRKLGNKHDKIKGNIVRGYFKIQTLLSRFKVMPKS